MIERADPVSNSIFNFTHSTSGVTHMMLRSVSLREWIFRHDKSAFESLESVSLTWCTFLSLFPIFLCYDLLSLCFDLHFLYVSSFVALSTVFIFKPALSWVMWIFTTPNTWDMCSVLWFCVKLIHRVFTHICLQLNCVFCNSFHWNGNVICHSVRSLFVNSLFCVLSLSNPHTRLSECIQKSHPNSQCSANLRSSAIYLARLRLVLNSLMKSETFGYDKWLRIQVAFYQIHILL